MTSGDHGHWRSWRGSDANSSWEEWTGRREGGWGRASDERKDRGTREQKDWQEDRHDCQEEEEEEEAEEEEEDPAPKPKPRPRLLQLQAKVKPASKPKAKTKAKRHNNRGPSQLRREERKWREDHSLAQQLQHQNELLTDQVQEELGRTWAAEVWLQDTKDRLAAQTRECQVLTMHGASWKQQCENVSLEKDKAAVELKKQHMQEIQNLKDQHAKEISSLKANHVAATEKLHADLAAAQGKIKADTLTAREMEARHMDEKTQMMADFQRYKAGQLGRPGFWSMLAQPM